MSIDQIVISPNSIDYSTLYTFSIPEAAERLGVSVRTVWRMLEAGELKAARPRVAGRPVRITASSLAALFAKADA